MNDQDKTKEELILELQELRLRNNSVKAPYNKDLTGHTVSEQGLHERENFVQAILQVIPDLIFRMDRQGIFLGYKADVGELYVQSDSTIVGKRNRDVTPIEFADLIESKILSTLETSTLQSFEYQLPIPERGMRSYEARMAVSGTDEVTAIVRDITERKQVEKILNDIIDKNPMSIQIVDKEGVTLRVNPAFIKLFGSVPAPNFSIFADLQSKNETLEKLILLAKSGIMVNLPEVCFNIHDIVPDAPDNPLWIRALIFPLMDINSEQERFVFMHEDITERKKAEEAKRLSQAFMNRIIEDSPTSLWISDERGTLIRMNQACRDILRLQDEEVVGKYNIFNDNIVEKQGFMPLVRDVFEKGATVRFVISYDTAAVEGLELGKTTSADLDVSISPITDSQGKVINAIIQHIDITKSKQAQQEINLKNKELQQLNAEKDKFFSIIAHDLRSPFNAFLGLTRLMVEELPSLTLDEIQRIVLSLRNSANKLYSLLENLLEWSQMKRGMLGYQPRSFNFMNGIVPILDSVHDSAKNKMISVGNDFPEDLMVVADKNMFASLIRNLLINAIKFTPKGGSVTIAAKPIQGNLVEVSISDTGIGMNKDLIDKLFTLGEDTCRKGTDEEPSIGLGLLICKDFVEKHNGKIWVESEERKGSTFYFTIPRDAEPGKEIDVKTSVSEKKETNPIKKLKILVAEDEEESDMFIQAVIKIFSKEIITAKTGIEALEICQNNPDIDLVLMDIKMPEMDGLEATLQIRQFNKELIIIAQTAYIHEGAREKAIEAGCNDYITKPINKYELLALIQKYFKK